MTNINAKKVLLLNGNYMPIGVVTVRDAVDLMMRGVAHAVEGVAARLQTPSQVFEVPSILRLRYYTNVPERNVTWSRHQVFKRDGYRCIYCGVELGDARDGQRLGRSDFTIDHINPQDQGGGNTFANTAVACYECNHRKANRTPNQAGLKLLWEPKRPRTNYLIVSGDVPKEWKQYIKFL